MDLYASRRIPATRPSTQRFRSPSSRGILCRLQGRAKEMKGQEQKSRRSAKWTFRQLGAESPSGGRVEVSWRGTSGPDGRERLKGPGMDLVSRPPERHRREGSLAAGRTRMSGWPSLWLLSLGQARESDSPRKGETSTLSLHEKWLMAQPNERPAPSAPSAPRTALAESA